MLVPNPLPGSYWLLKRLLLMTFVLHLVAMNFAMGGGLIAVFASELLTDRTSEGLAADSD